MTTYDPDLVALIADHGENGYWQLVANPTTEEAAYGVSTYVQRCVACGEIEDGHAVHLVKMILESDWLTKKQRDAWAEGWMDSDHTHGPNWDECPFRIVEEPQ